MSLTCYIFLGYLRNKSNINNIIYLLRLGAYDKALDMLLFFGIEKFNFICNSHNMHFIVCSICGKGSVGILTLV
jgi:hypothetical protein